MFDSKAIIKNRSMHSKTKTEERSIILIVSSDKDTASQNIARHILMLQPFKQTYEQFQDNPIHQTEIHNRKVQLVTLNQELVHAQNITDSFTNPELVIFISKHSSTSGKPTLSVHTPGNIADAQLGGIPRKVSISPANPMRTCLQAMTRATKNQKLDYEVSYEGTHHGPSLDVPTMFAELGSSPPQWNDTNAAKAVARAVIETISAFNEKPVETVLGIGGPHYNAKFTRMAL